MRLADDWRAVLRHAWSLRLSLLASVLGGLEVIIPILTDNPPMPRGAFAALAFAVSASSAVARVVAQEKLGDSK